MIKFLAAIVCLAVVFQECASLKCFKCNSKIDKSCSDGFESSSSALRESFLTQCDPKPDAETGELIQPYCKKVTMWLNQMTDPEQGTIETETRVDRNCGYGRRAPRADGSKRCPQTRSDDHVVYTCACDEDGCNTGATVQSVSVLAVLPGLAAVAMANLRL